MAFKIVSQRAAGGKRYGNPDEKKKKTAPAAAKSAPTPSPKPSQKDSPSPRKPGNKGSPTKSKMPKASMSGGGVNKTERKKGPARENPPSVASAKKAAGGKAKVITGKSPASTKTIVGVQRDQTGVEARKDTWRDLGRRAKRWWAGEFEDRKKN
jgi:hypothetical protein